MVKINSLGYVYPYTDLICQLTVNIIGHNSNKIIEVQIVSKNNMQILNKKLRNKNYVTDVLSVCSKTQNYIGSIIICDQALKMNFYQTLIHGILHLFGYLHDTDEQFKEMNELEKRIYQEFFTMQLL